jgi:uncharacterized membrane protein
MNSVILFAILAGVSAATWTICLKLGSTKISAALGAMVITGVAFVVNALALLTMRASGQEIVFSREAVWLLAIAGIAASGVDIFGLLAYERGLKVTSSFFIGGTSTLLVLLVGFRPPGALHLGSPPGDRPHRRRDAAAPGPGRLAR